MKKTTFVAFILLSAQCLASDLKSSLVDIESQWAAIYYQMPKQTQEKAYQALLLQTENLAKEFPTSAEPLFWQAVIKSTNAELQNGLSALKAVNEAKELLLQAIKLNPNTMDGSAYVTLGTLYYMVPGWPIAFGDNNEARKMFLSALKINPNAIDANYFYGDFLVSVNEIDEAQKHFEIASNAPARDGQGYTDIKLKEDAAMALKNLHSRKISHVKKLFLSLSSH